MGFPFPKATTNTQIHHFNLTNSIHVSKAHHGSADQFGQALPGFLITHTTYVRSCCTERASCVAANNQVVRILRTLFLSQCPYTFSSFLDLRNASNWFRLFSRDFRQFRFFLSGSECFSKVAPSQNLPSWVKYYGKFASFGKEFRWIQFVAVERVNPLHTIKIIPDSDMFFPYS